ncbi:MAG TPA: transposase [Patescibacteria group bacterium]|nr:transposase [Patescibacteria group bacterium]
MVSGYPHHITQRGVRSIPIFSNDIDRRAYLDTMAEQLSRFGVEALAWCLMTNHTHLIAVPKDSAMLARAIGEAHRRYTRMKNFADGVRGYLFQGRFGSCVLDEQHLLAAARYVELNPVHAGLVKKAEEYPWSSARFHLGFTTTDALVKDSTLRGLVDNWPGYLDHDDEEAQHKLLRAIRSGRPAGSEQFVTLIEQLTRRDLRLRKVGRPAKRVPQN